MTGCLHYETPRSASASGNARELGGDITSPKRDARQHRQGEKLFIRNPLLVTRSE